MPVAVYHCSGQCASPARAVRTRSPQRLAAAASSSSSARPVARPVALVSTWRSSLAEAGLQAKPLLRYRGHLLAAATAVTEGVSADKPALMSDAAAQRLPPPPISKSDEAFSEMGVEFVWSNELDMAELNDLFQKVGFPRRDPARLAVALGNTYRTVWVRAARKSRLARLGALLGFARATSDRALSATIWDVAVNPSWQRVGLGRAMVERLTASLVEDGISTVTLYAEPNVVGMYQKLGFVVDPVGVKGMAFQKSQAPHAWNLGNTRR